jgi:hypothetical protein
MALLSDMSIASNTAQRFWECLAKMLQHTPQNRQDYTCSLQQHRSEPHMKEFMVESVAYRHF